MSGRGCDGRGERVDDVKNTGRRGYGEYQRRSSMAAGEWHCIDGNLLCASEVRMVHDLA